MNKFTKSLIANLIEQENNVKAFFGGGFKPPTKGHFLAVKRALENYPEIDKLYVVVGSGLRDNISQDESLSIWEIYKKYLPIDKVEIIKSPSSPLKYIKDYIKTNTDHKSYVIIGTREDNDQDTNDFIQRRDLFDKYGDHIEVKNIVTKGEVSGTKAREAAKVSKEQFYQFLPSELSNEEKQTAFNYIQSAIKEGIDKRNLLEGKLTNKIKSKLKFILTALKQEGKETKEAFSKIIKSTRGDIDLTDEDKKEIGNQMKDVLKLAGLTAISVVPGGTIAAILIKLFKAENFITPSSFQKEKVDETGLEIATKNMDDYKKSNNPSGKQPRDPYGIDQYSRELMTEDESYDTFDYNTQIKSLSEFMLDLGLNVNPLPEVEFINDDSDNASNFLGKTAYYEPQYNRIVLYTLNRHPKDVMRSFAHEMIHHLQNREDRLGNITTQNTNEDDHLEQLEREAYEKGNIIFRSWTDSILNEGIVGNKIECDNCGWSWNIKDGGDDLYICHKCGHDNNPQLNEGRKKKKDPKVGTGKKPKGSSRRLYTDEDPKDTVSIKFSTKQDIVDTLNKTSFKSKSHKRQSQIINLIHQRVRAAIGRTKDSKKKKKLQSAFTYIKDKKEASKKKTQRLKKENIDPKAQAKHKGKSAPFGSAYEPVNENKTTHKVIAKGVIFSPKNITINVGDTVEWINEEGYHNVNGKKSHPRNKNNPTSFGNKVGSGWTYKFTFTKPGTYKYHCDPHLSADMVGTVKVKEVKKVLKEGRYDTISNKISSDIFKSWKENIEKEVNRFSKSYIFEDEDIDIEATLKLTPGTDNLNIDGGADSENDFIVVNFSIDPELLPKFWEEISMNLKDVVRHEIEHLTQGEGFQLKPGKFMKDDEFIRNMIDLDLLPKADYFKLEKEIDANLQGMYFRAKKEKRSFRDVIDTYLDAQDITSEEKEEILNLWRKRNKALSLPIFENKEKNMDYKIYSDMDGVLTDFEASFEKYSDGIPPREYENKFGKSEFWKLIDKKGKVGFWVGMPWMVDGKEYWDYIKNYDTELLSSPSYSDTSKLGKRLWVRNNLPGIKLNLARAADKQKYAAPNHILIDDRVSNIEQWKSQGGIGILHTSAADTIKQLQKLGL